MIHSGCVAVNSDNFFFSSPSLSFLFSFASAFLLLLLLLCHFPVLYRDLVCFVLSISLTCHFLPPICLFSSHLHWPFWLSLPATSTPFPFYFIYSILFSSFAAISHTSLLICFFLFLTLCSHSICLPHPYLSHFPPSDSTTSAPSLFCLSFDPLNSFLLLIIDPPIHLFICPFI